MFELITHAFVCALNLNQHSGVPLKIKRLARDSERFIWAVSMAPTRCIGMQMRIGKLLFSSNHPRLIYNFDLVLCYVHIWFLFLLIGILEQMVSLNHLHSVTIMFPFMLDCCLINLLHFADMLNHSFEPNCFFHWRFKDRMLEVMINAGKRIKKGDEMTVNYMSGQQNDMLMQRYGFSSPVNPWDVIPFSGNARIHLDSFLSVFNMSGLHEEYYHNRMRHLDSFYGLFYTGFVVLYTYQHRGRLSNDGDTSVDGAIIAAARTLPTWSEGDVPPIPSMERKAIKELQEECRQIIAAFPTNSKQDQKILGQTRTTLDDFADLDIRRYRLHRKLFIEKVMQALDLYQERILF
ncbi:hypothetical protein DVH24_010999 [Malus domestica]|uniref:SET domain-containing protein n=1 Tax=Malus domestica TaxID=3750 RepID=A0A498JY14_MALDO|nr:hypothetical protein DVH24_010999 [Malus domestica]